MATSEPTLVTVLRRRGCLLEGEQDVLLHPDVRALTAEAQLEHLRIHRRVGRAVTAVSGGLRLALLGGAALVMAAMAQSGALPIAGWSIAVWVALVVAVAWLTPSFGRRLRELGRPLPTWNEVADEIGSP